MLLMRTTRTTFFCSNLTLRHVLHVHCYSAVGMVVEKCLVFNPALVEQQLSQPYVQPFYQPNQQTASTAPTEPIHYSMKTPNRTLHAAAMFTLTPAIVQITYQCPLSPSLLRRAYCPRPVTQCRIRSSSAPVSNCRMCSLPRRP